MTKKQYEVSIKATVEYFQIVEADSEMEACDEVASEFHDSVDGDTVITDIIASESRGVA